MVRARALIEERWAEVTVTLAAAHPLEPPRVDPPQNQVLAASQLHWVRVYLAYQNGWLVTALRLWSEALRSRVDAAAQCYICYCRLHPTTARLPNVPCYTCNNRFHSACLVSRIIIDFYLQIVMLEVIKIYYLQLSVVYLSN